MQASFRQALSTRYLDWLRHRSILELVVLGVVLTSALSLLLNFLDAPRLGHEFVNWLEAWFMDFSTDLAGGGLTFLFFRSFMKRQETAGEVVDTTPKTTYFIEEEQVEPASEIEALAPFNIEDQREPLLVQLHRAATPEARQGVLDTLRNEDWLPGVALVDFNLQRADLSAANLVGADFTKANLRSADLRGANLQGAVFHMTQLIEANLTGADLSRANLDRVYISGANLAGVKLEGAKVQTSLWGVNLQNASLREADLRGAELFRTDLRGADLSGARLDGAKINAEALLPDGSTWNGKTELGRFTDPQHPRFWRSDDPASPAFSGSTDT